MQENLLYSSNRLAHTILRVFLGTMLLFHGVAKLQHGIDGIVGMIAALGLPTFLAYGVYVGEVLAPVLLITGWLVRPAALIVIVNMLVAVGLAHSSQIFMLSKNGGWAIELQAFYLVAAVLIAIQTPVVSVRSFSRAPGDGPSCIGRGRTAAFSK